MINKTDSVPSALMMSSLERPCSVRIARRPFTCSAWNSGRRLVMTAVPRAGMELHLPHPHLPYTTPKDEQRQSMISLDEHDAPPAPANLKVFDKPNTQELCICKMLEFRRGRRGRSDKCCFYISCCFNFSPMKARPFCPSILIPSRLSIPFMRNEAANMVLVIEESPD